VTCSSVVANWLQPRILPEQSTRSLASAVGCTVASKVSQVDGSRKASAPPGSVHGLAGLVRDCADMKALPAKFKHFRHEGKLVYASVLVERGENVLLAADFDERAGAKA
jgi:hypothetical protein